MARPMLSPDAGFRRTGEFNEHDPHGRMRGLAFSGQFSRNGRFNANV